MRTLIIGGGRGCVAVLDLLEQGKLGSLSPQVVAIADIDPDAPGMQIARSRGWMALSDLEAGLALERLELVLELTGSEEVLTRVRHRLPPGVRLVDHVIASQTLWECTTCMACVAACPVDIDHLSMILNLRRNQVLDVGDIEPEYQRVFTNM